MMLPEVPMTAAVSLQKDQAYDVAHVAFCSSCSSNWSICRAYPWSRSHAAIHRDAAALGLYLGRANLER